MNYVIKTKNLNKRYRSKEVLKDININIGQGEVYGLIGKNGAGKTTLMRIISGLSHQNEGELELFEKGNDLIKSRKRIGVLIETPAFFEDLDAYKNLEMLRRAKGIPGKACVDEKLELVGLTDVRGKNISEYSLGMKQKLGLAIALLSDPEILILDEPTNGLDPMGIATMRELLRKLNKERGITILISSHILSELNKIATVYGIMRDGKLVEEISFKELEEKSKKSLDIVVNNPEKCTYILENILEIKDYTVLDNNVIKIYEKIDDGAVINKELALENIYVSEMKVSGESLEKYVLRAMEGDRK